MKKLILIFLISVSTFAQYAVKDTTQSNAQSIRQLAVRLLQIANDIDLIDNINIVRQDSIYLLIYNAYSSLEMQMDQNHREFIDSINSINARIGFITPTFPDKPTGLIASQSGNNILIRWNDMVADSFQLTKYYSDPLFGGDPFSSSVYLTDTFYIDVAPAVNSIFWYGVQSWRNTSYSAMSNIDSAYRYQATATPNNVILADYYFDAENGSSSNTGTTPSSAWDLSRFNSTTFSPGDVIAFRDSMTYRVNNSSSIVGLNITENGTSDDRITITNWYGAASDSFPIFDGSLLVTNAWTATSTTNIWQTTLARSTSGNIRAVWFSFQDSIRWGGIRQAGINYLTQEFECFNASGSNVLYIYCDQDPNTRYKKVEYNPYAGSTSETQQTFNLSGDYVTLQYLDFKSANYDGLYITQYSNYAEVLDCNFYYNGASWFWDASNVIGGDNGNGIEVHGDNSIVKRTLMMENGSHGYSIYGNNGQNPTDNTVDSCLFINNHHTNMVDINNQSQTGYVNLVDGVTIRWNRSYVTDWFPYDRANPEIHSGNMWMSRDESSLPGQTRNIVFHNNLVYGGDPCMNVEVSVDSMWIYNNTFIHPDPTMSYVWYGTANGNDMHFFNNIGVSYYTYPAIARDIVSPGNPPQGNVIWMVSGAYNGWYSGNVPANNYNDTDPLFTGYTSGTKIWTVNDIDFDSYVDTRFTLQSGSPARGYGINAGTTYNKSLNGVTRTTTWDAGCYQYVP